MNCSNIDWQLNATEAHWHQHASIRRISRFAPHPPGRDRRPRPDNENAAGALQFLCNQLIKFLSGSDLRVPPDAEALGLDGSNQRFHTSTVRPRVREEHISHCTTLCLERQKVKPRRAAHCVMGYGADRSYDLESTLGASIGNG